MFPVALNNYVLDSDKKETVNVSETNKKNYTEGNFARYLNKRQM